MASVKRSGAGAKANRVRSSAERINDPGWCSILKGGRERDGTTVQLASALLDLGDPSRLPL